MANTPASDAASLAHRYREIYTGALSDTLDELGWKGQVLPREIVPLAPGMRVAGPAFPVEGRSNPTIDPDLGARRLLEMLGAVPAGAVAVYQPSDSTCAHFGELSATSLRARGCAGVVVDGGCRDYELVCASGLSVFCKYRTPVDAIPRWEVLEWGHSVEIEGVRILNGDYVVGDADGLVIIPKDLVATVLERAEAFVGTENLVRDAVRNGMAPLEAYEKFGAF
jgi:4-hydroxy-4-methyl-2-oxoglutarate aldolase